MICAHAVSTIIPPPPSTIIFRIDIAHIYKKKIDHIFQRTFLVKNKTLSVALFFIFLYRGVLKIGGVIVVWLVYMATKENHVFAFAELSMGIFKI
jgi:hypothetical protein